MINDSLILGGHGNAFVINIYVTLLNVLKLITSFPMFLNTIANSAESFTS